MKKSSCDSTRILGLVGTTIAHLRTHIAALETHRARHPEADRDPNFTIAEAALLRALAGAIDEARLIRAM